MELIEEAYDEKSLDVAWALKFDVRTDNLRSDHTPTLHDSETGNQ